MDFTTNKYGVLFSFSANWHFSVKPKAITLDYEPNFEIYIF
jgi:hypothetical protein